MPPSTSAVDRDIHLLHRLADEADRQTLPVWEAGRFEVEIKPDGSPVTETDRAVESALLDLVSSAFPNDGFLGEEVGAHPGSSGRTWVVDGIDGTRNFIDRQRRWSTLIALTVDGTAIAGAITSPALGRRWSTTIDGRAEVEPTSNGGAGQRAEVAVSPARELDGTRIAVWPTDDWALRLLVERHQRLLDLVGRPMTASAIVDEPIPHGAVPVLDGRLDAMIAFSGQAWDHAGPAAIVAAAGGRMSAIDGTPAFDTGAAVYSNGHIHDDLVAILAAG